MKISNALITNAITALLSFSIAILLVMTFFEPVPRGSATAANTPVATPSSLQREQIPGCVYIDPSKSKDF